MQTHKGESWACRDLDVHDFFVEGVDLLGSRVSCEAGVAFFVAAVSAFRRAPVRGATVILGDISIQGNIKGLPTSLGTHAAARDNGAKSVLVPTANRRPSAGFGRGAAGDGDVLQ